MGAVAAALGCDSPAERACCPVTVFGALNRGRQGHYWPPGAVLCAAARRGAVWEPPPRHLVGRSVQLSKLHSPAVGKVLHPGNVPVAGHRAWLLGCPASTQLGRWTLKGTGSSAGQGGMGLGESWSRLLEPRRAPLWLIPSLVCEARGAPEARAASPSPAPLGFANWGSMQGLPASPASGGP